MGKNMKIFAIYLVTVLFFGCVHTASQNDPFRSPAGTCPVNPEAPHLFNVIENNEKQIVVEIGDFAKYFNLSGGNYSYSVTFKGIRDESLKAPPPDPVVAKGDIHGTAKVTVPVRGSGVYLFSLSQGSGKPFWKQKVFSIAPQDRLLTEAEKNDLAKMYAPIISYHDQEQYFPVSLEYLTNQVEKDAELDKEPFVITNKSVAQSIGNFFGGTSTALNVKFQFKDILNVLPYMGHSESVLKSGLSNSAETSLKRRYGQNHATVYYSVFENVKWKEILINYHFYYTYDPKNGTAKKDVLPAHIFDRESMTVVLRSTSKQPLYVYYGAHLPTQTMAQLGSDGKVLQSWLTGRTRVNWEDKYKPEVGVNKFETHPIPAIALGSHGVYPKVGNYAVMFNQVKALLEPAGGNKFLVPNFVTNFTRGNRSTYELKSFKLENVVSGCSPANILAYSGATVDVLGPVNATFPPFTDREENFMSYADPNSPLFDMTK